MKVKGDYLDDPTYRAYIHWKHGPSHRCCCLGFGFLGVTRVAPGLRIDHGRCCWCTQRACLKAGWFICLFVFLNFRGFLALTRTLSVSKPTSPKEEKRTKQKGGKVHLLRAYSTQMANAEERDLYSELSGQIKQYSV